jgi:hypothetical protein
LQVSPLKSVSTTAPIDTIDSQITLLSAPACRCRVSIVDRDEIVLKLLSGSVLSGRHETHIAPTGASGEGDA